MKQKKVLLLAAVAMLVLLLIPGSVFGASLMTDTANLIISFEGFSPTPYYDNKRYSWGYGTKAPGATGTITEAQARAELMQHVQNDLSTLQPLITRNLSQNQWAALLSFAYNEGTGNSSKGAIALVDDINNDSDNLESHWKEYIYADNVIDQDLIERRAKEWAVWGA